MGFAPVLNPLPIVGIAEVVPVLRFAQPTLLSDSLAGTLALRSRTKLLMSPIPVIRDKQLLTVQTLAAMRFGLHQIEAASLKNSGFGPQAVRNLTPKKMEKRREEEIFE